MRGPRIATLFGTRPEAIKLAPVIQALGQLGEEQGGPVDLINVSSGQHSHLVRPFTEAFGVSIDHDLEVGTPDQSATDIASAVLARFDALLARIEPDLVLVQGDTTTAMSGALACFHRRVRIGHVEAGLRSGNASSPFPEEMNRRLITQMADVHFAATDRNVRTLKAEGVEEDRVILTGNPVVDAVAWATRHTTPGPRVRQLLDAVRDRRLIAVTTHRRESFGEVMIARLQVLSRFVSAHEDVAIVFPVHPNPNVRRAVDEALPESDRVHRIEPLGYFDFIHLLSSSWLIVSDSGGVQEEAPTLGKPVLVIRENTERPEAIEAGVARLVGPDAATLELLLEECNDDPAWIRSVRAAENPFGAPGASDRIARAACEVARRAASKRADSRGPRT